MAGRNQRIGVADGQTVREARVRCRADARSGARGDELFVDYAGDTVPVIIDRLTDFVGSGLGNSHVRESAGLSRIGARRGSPGVGVRK